MSLVVYVVGIALSFVHSWLGFALYVVVAAMWFIPDKRIESVINREDAQHEIEKHG